MGGAQADWYDISDALEAIEAPEQDNNEHNIEEHTAYPDEAELLLDAQPTPLPRKEKRKLRQQAWRERSTLDAGIGEAAANSTMPELKGQVDSSLEVASLSTQGTPSSGTHVTSSTCASSTCNSNSITDVSCGRPPGLRDVSKVVFTSNEEIAATSA